MVSKSCLWASPLLVLALSACTRDPETVKARALERAARHEESGALGAAIIEYRNAVQATPADGVVRLKLAEAYARAGDLPHAAAEYGAAADRLPDDVAAQFAAGNLALLSGRYDDAKVRADRVVAIEPASFDGLLLRAGALAGLGEFEAAVSSAEEAIRLRPDAAAGHMNLGAIEARRGRIARAENAFTRATTVEPDAVAPHLTLANFYWSRDRPREAQQAARAALEADPDNVLAHQLLAAVAVAIKDYGRAEEHLSKVVELQPTTEARLALSDFYAERNRPDAAISTLAGLAGERIDPEVEVRLAVLDRQLGHATQAYARLERVLSAAPDSTRAFVSKSAFLVADRRLPEALDTAKEAVRRAPRSADAHFALGGVHQALGDAKSAESEYAEAARLNPGAATAWLALARLQLSNGRSGEAVESAQRAVRSGGPEPASTLALVLAQTAAGALASAERSVDRLVADFPGAAEARLAYGVWLARTGEKTAARRELELALALRPEFPDAISELTALDVSAGRYDVALSRLEPRRRVAPGSADLATLVARVHIARGDLSEAERVLGAFTVGTSPDPGALSLLAQITATQNRRDAAVELYERLAGIVSTPANALTMAGMIRQQQGRVGDARLYFERALGADPDAVLAANNLAWIYTQDETKLDRAVELALVAYRKRPEDAGIADTLGVAYHRRGQILDAVRVLREAVRLRPGKAAYHHHLGVALADAGDNAEAAKQLTQALSLEPSYPEANALRARLATLQF